MSKEKLSENQSLKKVLAILKFAILAGIVIGIPLYLYFCQHDFIAKMSSLHAVQQFFKKYETQSVLIYLGAQILQIVICFIPGQVLQITAGLAYGFWVGFLWCMVGCAMGTVITFYLAKFLGRDAMHLFFGKEKVQKYEAMFNSKRAFVVVLLVYLIPGIPKDLCCYLAGLSEIKLKPFLILSLIGRTPAMMASLLIGMQLGVGRWQVTVAILAGGAVLLILGLIFRKKLMSLFNKIYEKLKSD
ncbi:MAG: TVP38/TMEM64 family protein [Anaerovoracaceae bacterium]|jgi:uncharacterized membrane protein YdjX (TVP38/TMEM64 family)